MGGATSVARSSANMIRNSLRRLQNTDDDGDSHLFSPVPGNNQYPHITFEENSSNSCTLKIISVNDVYKFNHLPRLATCKDIESKQKDGNHVIAVLPGDFLAPSLMSALDKGAGMVDVMNAAGFDYVCIGNHESDITLDQFHDRIKESKFQWINSNMQDLKLPIEMKSLPEYIIIEIKNENINHFHSRRIALLGLNTGDPSVYRPWAFDGCIIENVNEKAKELYNKIMKTENVDIIIPLTHQYIDDDRELARTGLFPIIIGGHDHDPYPDEIINNCRIVKAGMDAEYIALSSITWLNNKSTQPIISFQLKDAQLYPLKTEVQVIVEEHEQILNELQSSILCQIPSNLELSSIDMRKKETTVGTFICTAVRDGLLSDLCVMNAGAIRNGHRYCDEKVFTYANLLAELPFPTGIVVIELPGQIICDMISYSRRLSILSPSEESAGFLQTDDGVKWDRNENEIKLINNQIINYQKLYMIALPWILLIGIDDIKPLLNYMNTNNGEYLKKITNEQSILIHEIIVSRFSKMLLFQLIQSERFEDIDTDHDGCISKEELIAVANKKYGTTGGLNQRVITNLFNIADTDGSGSIDIKEVVGVYISSMNTLSQHIGEEESIEELKTRITTAMNGDENLLNMVNTSLHETDRDGDNVMDESELREFHLQGMSNFLNKKNDPTSLIP